MSLNGMLAGWFDGLTQPIGNIIDTVKNIPNLIISALQYAISALIYGIQIGFFWLIDMVQMVFRRVAGLDVYWYKESNGSFSSQEGDIVETFLRSDTVWNVFLAVIIAAIILLFVTTFISILKTELNEKDNSKGPVIKNALKAVMYFVLVPVVCIFGITLANIFLRSFDKATAIDGAVSISGQVFAAAAYNANRVRNNTTLAQDENLEKVIQRLQGVSDANVKIRSSSSRAEVADALDYVFVHGLVTSQDVAYQIDKDNHYMSGYSQFLGGGSSFHNTTFDKNNIEIVYYYYDLLKYNYLIGFFMSYTLIMLLLNLMIGVVQRLFDLTVLFIASPAFIATMPLDGGSRYGKWRDKFVSKTLGLYGPIVGINLAFTVLTLVQRIYIFDPNGGGLNGLFNALMQCIFVITAILCVKDFGKLINELVGGDDITNNKAAEVRDVMSKGAAAVAKVAGPAARLGVAAAKSGVSFVNNSAKGVWSHIKEAGDQGALTGKQRQINREIDNRWQDKMDNLRQQREEADSAFNGLSVEDKKRIFDNRWNNLSEEEQLAWGDRSAAENDAIADQWYREDSGYNNRISEIEAEEREVTAKRNAQRDTSDRYFNTQKNNIRRQYANQRTEYSNAFADSVINVGKNVGSTLQGIYGAGKGVYNGSAAYAAGKTFREAGGTKALEEGVVGVADEIVNKQKPAEFDDYGNPTKYKPYIEQTIKNIRGNIKASATAKKNKEEGDAAKAAKANNVQLAKMIANEILKGLRGGSGGTP